MSQKPLGGFGGVDPTMMKGQWPKGEPSFESESSGKTISCFSSRLRSVLCVSLCSYRLVHAYRLRFSTLRTRELSSLQPLSTVSIAVFLSCLSLFAPPPSVAQTFCTRCATRDVSSISFLILQRSPLCRCGQAPKALNLHPGDTPPSPHLTKVLVGYHHGGTYRPLPA